ncbi:MAG: glycerol-3-phosphate 1-O-acyltransferase PlsY [Lactobacillus sp.]|nr:glycerol-3-phosphate 1-O-acyltransferase PlsY [Lactobacillus sp.]
MFAIKFASLLILAYLIGSVPMGVIVGKTFFHKDIRQYGSGNIGTTNTFRVLGVKAGTFVFLFDFLKGTVATMIPLLLGSRHQLWCLLCGVAVILGHAFSIFLKFKGGKAVATTAGFLLGYNLSLFWICFFIFFPLLFITSMVSLTSLIAILLIIFVTLGFHDIPLSIMTAILVVLIYWNHRSNMLRIWHHDENLVPFGLVYWFKQHRA